MLQVRDFGLTAPSLSGRRTLAGISFDVRTREVLGVTGRPGSGGTELLEGLAGAGPAAPLGDVRLEGRPARFRTPRQAVRAGVSLLTSDPEGPGLFPDLTVGRNLTIASLGRFTWPGGLINPLAEAEAVDAQLGQLAIRASGRRASVSALSPGDRRKCLIGRLLMNRPKLLLLDEPTRGIDTVSRGEIHTLIRRLSASGVVVIVASADPSELRAVCDRVLVLREGRLAADLSRAEATLKALPHESIPPDRAGVSGS